MEGSKEAYIQYLPNNYFWNGYVKETIEGAVNDLFISAAPQKAHDELLALSNNADFFCLDSNPMCPQYYSLLGLSSELINDDISATSNYLKTWRKYQYSPYAIYARLKLTFSIMAPTLTPTTTPTIIIPQ
jgi:hypothetical protein